MNQLPAPAAPTNNGAPDDGSNESAAAKSPPPAPVSGQIPSPTGGVRTRASSDHAQQQTQLRHRLHHHHHQQQQHRRAQREDGSPGGRRSQRGGRDDRLPRRQLSNSLLGSYSLDDADAAAGATIEFTPMRRSSISEERRRGGTPTHDDSRRQQRPSEFPASSATERQRQRQRQPPLAQRMELGINQLLLGGGGGGGGGWERAAYYGGSEHDFNDDHSYYSSGNSSSSDPARGRTTEEIMTENGQHRRQDYASRANCYPQYGVPVIRGSSSETTNGTAGNEKHNDNDDVTDYTAEFPPSSSPATPPPGPRAESFVDTADAGKGEYGNNDKFKVLGWDMSKYSRRSQFLISASGTFGFSLVYGYVQELISVTLCNRKLGLFLALAQFSGYTVLSYFFRKLDAAAGRNRAAGGGGGGACGPVGQSSSSSFSFGAMSLSMRMRRKPAQSSIVGGGGAGGCDRTTSRKTIPLEMYIALSVLRAIDLGMTNLAMQYVNYPAKTIMKSTRVVFTMMFGVIVSKKRYGPTDYCIVGIMVTGLAMFFHADANTSAVFNPLGIIMLTISLLCDGAISNMSEALMNQYEVGQDEYIFRLYSIATCFICIAAGVKGDLRDGLAYLTRPGTLREIEEGLEPTWSVFGKVFTIALLALTGFLGSSCSAAITKSFGALTSSITSTARKAATIFLSFALFPNNKCTLEHIGGIFFFIASLVVKSLRHSKRGKGGSHHRRHVQQALNKEDNYHSATTDASNENAPLICSSPAYLRRNVGDDFV